MSEIICGTCHYHRYDKESDDWICMNPDSDLAGCWTDYGYHCMDWEDKDEWNQFWRDISDCFHCAENLESYHMELAVGISTTLDRIDY